LLSSETSAAIINFCAGFSAMLATVATVTLAADYCPPRAEGFSFAVLMSVINLSNSVGDNVGSYLYANVFARSLPPLIIISAAFTAFAFILVPLLHLGEKPQGAPAHLGDHLKNKVEPDATSAR
jgi:predicted MFS family arabinose efflux permease